MFNLCKIGEHLENSSYHESFFHAVHNVNDSLLFGCFNIRFNNQNTNLRRPLKPKYFIWGGGGGLVSSPEINKHAYSVAHPPTMKTNDAGNKSKTII